jgi:hypothetical protein
VEGAIEGSALNNAFNPRSIDAPTERQNIACLRTHHEVLIVDCALYPARLIRPFEMARNHSPFLLKLKKLRRRCSVWIFAVQRPLARDVSGLLLRWRLLRERKATNKNQSKTKYEGPQAMSLQNILQGNVTAQQNLQEFRNAFTFKTHGTIAG